MLPSDDIFSSGWTKIVFAGRNQAYGAYQLRQTSERRLIVAFLITIMLFSAFSGYSFYRFNSGEMAEVDIPVVPPTNILPPPTDDEIYVAPPKEKVEPPKAEVAVNTTAFVPKIAKDIPIVNDIRTQDELQDLNIGSKNIVGVDSAALFDERIGETNITGTMNVDQVFTVVEQMPEFPGGQRELLKYLAEKTVYPRVPLENDIEGTVYVNFVIDKAGDVTQVEIAREGEDKYLEKEAIRVIKSMPRWKPGKQNGKEVRVKYTVPIKFVLN